MLPSLLSHEISQGLRQFLVTAYEAADPFFHGCMGRFVAEPAALAKGPYLQLGLPFRGGSGGAGFFEGVELPFSPWQHQEDAWQRLASTREAANTLIATGTGSGKTECFLYPVLEHCARAKHAGEHGIKALVIYPMNALAADQARRFAATVHTVAAFAGLRVGMYVGGDGGRRGNLVMTPDACITDRESLRTAPPDVLLTNYKMLDYLLVRPRDRQLWSKNGPDTLRYVVVDELHTFDGAQGTDLALLLRRLRARLGADAERIVCVGTSATLGNSADPKPLCEYATQVFGTTFTADSVITESRQSLAEFLGDQPIEFLLQPGTDFARVLRESRDLPPAAAVAAWFALFFPGEPVPADVNDPGWRERLGELLKRHLLFANLLRLSRGAVSECTALAQQLSGPLPEAARPLAVDVLDALIALVAWARGPMGRPLLTVRLQLWLRELRRMVASVRRDPGEVRLHHSAELRVRQEHLHLPLIQCSECHTTGWLASRPAGATRIETGLDIIYNTWFAGRTETMRMYPGARTPRADRGFEPMCEGVHEALCCACGQLQRETEACNACGHDELVQVFRVTAEHQTTQGDAVRNWHAAICPACGARNRLILLGARTATLGAQIVEHGWASSYNDDKKLIAFSDSVQDAAHRAGFFGARTYLNNVRAALTRAVHELATPTVQWSQFLERVAELWLDPVWPGHLPSETFVAEFIGPDMTWQKDWQRLQMESVLPGHSPLLSRVKKRLAWQAFAEFTFSSQRGRTLDRLGVAAVVPRPSAVREAAGQLLVELREKHGLRHLDERDVCHWLWGLLLYLKRRGAVFHPELEHYAVDGNLYGLSRFAGRNLWLPSMGEFVPHPVFLGLGRTRHFDTLVNRQRTSWYERWMMCVLGRDGLLPTGAVDVLYGEAFASLQRAGLMREVDARGVPVLGLDPASLELHRDTARLYSAQGRRTLTVPRDLAEELLGMPCLDSLAEHYTAVDDATPWLARRFATGDLRRVISAEHTGLIARDSREALEQRFKARGANQRPWFENLLSATPTLEMGVDIGDLSSVMLCSVPPSQASYLQRVGRAGRTDGNSLTVTLADGASPHDLYFFETPLEMMAGEVVPPGVFLQAAEVLRRQLMAFCMDHWVASGIAEGALPDKTSAALDAVQNMVEDRFPYTLLNHIKQNEQELFDRFTALLGDALDERTRDRLAEYMFGLSDDSGIRQRMLRVFDELVHERASRRKLADTQKTRINALKQLPEDEATRAQIAEISRERDKSMEIIREINGRDLLGTMTDAGLLPNYAFPEAGIELKSLLWRHRTEDDDGEARYIALPAERYERPASSALSEFAPENRFYANRRRVEIDQINMQLTNAEEWRLCPSCHHAQSLLAVGDGSPVCPVCGDPMWSNVAQKRTLLRFRQAIANSNEVDAHIDDRAEDREPRFYLRQLLVSFDRKTVGPAWKLENDALPFGFEFVPLATFRDINFGEVAKQGESFRVAGQDRSRPGFRLCRHCGTVQRPPRRRDPNPPAQNHARDCPKFGGSDPADIIDCLYLYREFSSEALRILVPYTSVGVDDIVLQSFIAALQLGLKQRFGGKVEHLRVTTQEEPGPAGSRAHRYVVLYDSVPGGTGYLHQLLSQDAQTLGDVLKLARHQIVTCPCNDDEHRDGCHRCLYQYRQGRAMAEVSRRAAAQVLDELIGSLDRLVKVPTLSEIFINPQFDSELEQRFPEGLRRLGGKDKLPNVKLLQEVVQGKLGYLLEVGSEHYWVETQALIGPEHGVAEISKVDFLISPVNPRSPRRPIAVFTDGWQYHRDITRKDARQRSALVASGRYWAWSVTWADVESALAGDTSTKLSPPLERHGRLRPADAVMSRLRPSLAPGLVDFVENSVALLLRWLATPVAPGEDDPFVTGRRGPLAWVMASLMGDVKAADYAPREAALKTFTESWPDWLADQIDDQFPAVSRDPTASTSIHAWWPPAFARGRLCDGRMPGVVLYSPGQAAPDTELQSAWREWLWLYNQLQILPGLYMFTREGIEARDYDGLLPKVGLPSVAGDDAEETSSSWSGVFEQAVRDVHAGLATLREVGLPAPDAVGHELGNAAGEVLAEAELAWTQPKIVLLLPSQLFYAEAWHAAGWNTVEATPEWPSVLIEKLNEETNNVP